MDPKAKNRVEQAKKAAIEVLRHNAQGPFNGLPRTAGWGYPEPYTRDLMICMFGIGALNDEKLLESMKKVLLRLAENQSENGHIPSLVHDADDRGASDTTPLFLIGVYIYRRVSRSPAFLEEALQKSIRWMEHQSPSDQYLVAQQPTSDWRDEQWVLGYGLFVNALVYTYLLMGGDMDRAGKVKAELEKFTITQGHMNYHVHEGLVVKHKPYYALWSYKIYNSERFDLLGNSLAILSGLSSPTRSKAIVQWVERECEGMKKNGELAVDLPPNFFPFIKPGDPDWIERYTAYNLPGNYHNGGIWPFICGFYIASLVTIKRYRLAEKKLLELTDLVEKSVNEKLNFGFNEWLDAGEGLPRGQDWQSWSAAMYLYAAICVEQKETPFFDAIRRKNNE